MRIGILFGGQSREREISFAGGRTVYDNLNKALFTPVPIFVDSLGNFILLDWQYLYKGTIRDFYPPAAHTPDSPHFFQIYVESLANEPGQIEKSIQSIGKKISPEELRELVDFAFLTLHGPYGEDGNIQGILEWYGVPYSGAGILPGSIGIDKVAQKQLLLNSEFPAPANETIRRADWINIPEEILNAITQKYSFPLVLKAPHQGSSIGVNIVTDRHQLITGLNRSFFIEKLETNRWKAFTVEEKRSYLITFTDIREGLGFPVIADGDLIWHPEQLWEVLDQSQKQVVILESPDGESAVLVESYIEGKEFSCIVIEDENGKPVALPPTEIRKSSKLFDYRSKYLPGISRKITPIHLPEADIERIRKICEKLFTALHSQVYARIDGFFSGDGTIYLNDPNTTSGMLPSSFFFHQAAEIGLNPSQFLTYIVSRSLEARMTSGKNYFRIKSLKHALMAKIKQFAQHQEEKTKVAVIMGGFSTERHISVESGRNIYEKLSSSTKYLPVPVFLTGTEQEHLLFKLPVNIMLKDNADDIREKIHHHQTLHPVIERIQQETGSLRRIYAIDTTFHPEAWTYDQLASQVDFAFIALHGRPGEDGAVQEELEKRNIPYNGSGIQSSKISINKYETNEILHQNGIPVARHALVFQEEYEVNKDKTIAKIETAFPYPFIAKPADDGCSSAVKKIKSRVEFQAFCEMMFRPDPVFPDGPMKALNLKYSEEFPQKPFFLIEELITPNGADRFMEITGGMLTHLNNDGTIRYEIFEPSEVLASGEVLSLEEKFLAGEGQNITPARFGRNESDYERIAASVKSVLEKTAKLINVEGYCRIDAFVRIFPHKVETVIIEINSLPGMTPATAIFHQSALNNMKPYEFIDKIIEFGFARQGRR